jgi:pyruvate formate lyase activating enzyme
VHECPGKALKNEGELKSVQEVIDIVMQDLPFYEESGGGVTLSGGEAAMQPDFALALLKALRKKRIHTAIETTGFTSPAVFAKLLPYLDLLLFDIKHWDNQKHIEGTGVSNAVILKNMKTAIEQGKNVLPRLPVIPGYNDSLADAEGFVQRLQETGARRVQLLPFHQFGENKYHLLRKEYAFAHTPALHPEDLAAFQHVFIQHGIDAFF